MYANKAGGKMQRQQAATAILMVWGCLLLIAGCGLNQPSVQPPPETEAPGEDMPMQATTVSQGDNAVSETDHATNGLAGGESMNLTSTAFQQEEPIPARHSCDGADTSPELHWEHAPAGVESFALIMDDPDAPGRTFVHWVLFDIPATTQMLEEGVSGVGIGGKNDFGKMSYSGPCPPPGHGPHRYFFKLYALDVATLNLAPGATKSEVEAAMQSHILAETRLMGVYERK
jgi:hypothetical protein